MGPLWSGTGRELPREGEVVQPGDAEHGDVNAIALQTAVAKDLPGLHPGKDVFDAGANLLVGLVVGLFPAGEILFRLSAPSGTVDPGVCGAIAAARSCATRVPSRKKIDITDTPSKANPRETTRLVPLHQVNHRYN